MMSDGQKQQQQVNLNEQFTFLDPIDFRIEDQHVTHHHEPRASVSMRSDQASSGIAKNLGGVDPRLSFVSNENSSAFCHQQPVWTGTAAPSYRFEQNAAAPTKPLFSSRNVHLQAPPQVPLLNSAQPQDPLLMRLLQQQEQVVSPLRLSRQMPPCEEQNSSSSAQAQCGTNPFLSVGGATTAAMTQSPAGLLPPSSFQLSTGTPYLPETMNPSSAGRPHHPLSPEQARTAPSDMLMLLQELQLQQELRQGQERFSFERQQEAMSTGLRSSSFALQDPSSTATSPRLPQFHRSQQDVLQGGLRRSSRPISSQQESFLPPISSPPAVVGRFTSTASIADEVSLSSRGTNTRTAFEPLGGLPAPSIMMSNDVGAASLGLEDEGRGSSASTYEPPVQLPAAGIESRHLKKQTFPERLYGMLMDLKREGKTDIASFVDNGKAFVIHNPQRFQAEVMPLYFASTRLSSLQRQLNLYGFQRNLDPKSTSIRGSYRNRNFVEGQPDLLRNIVRQSAPMMPRSPVIWSALAKKAKKNNSTNKKQGST